VKFVRNLIRGPVPVVLEGRYWSARQLTLARVFPVSEATLQAHARKHGIGRMLGRTRVVSADDVTKLYEVLPCPSNSSNAPGPLTGSSGVPLVASGTKKVQELLTKKSLNKSGSSSKPTSTKKKFTAKKLS
jgi:hypothetical protein